MIVKVVLVLYVAFVKVTSAQPHCVCLRSTVETLRNPTKTLYSNDRIFILQQNGIVLELDKGNVGNTRTYIDIKDRLHENWEFLDERGLLGMAFAPDFDISGHFYIFYVTTDQKGNHFGQLSELTEKDGLPSPLTEKSLLRIEMPEGRANGGDVLFGDDGYLYLSIGDGEINSVNQAQNGSSLLGKILRIDVTGTSGHSTYKHIDHQGARQWRPEIYASGFKNARGCSVDPGDSVGRGRGRIICAETGTDFYDEINIIYPGGNYGWDIREGEKCRIPLLCAKQYHEIPPMHTIKHEAGAYVAVVGGVVYRGNKFQELQGYYLYGDVFQSDVRYLEPNDDGTCDEGRLSYCNISQCPADARDAPLNHMLSLGSSIDGEILLTMTSSLDAQSPTGAMFELVIRDGGSERHSTSDGFIPALPSIVASIVVMTSRLIVW